MIIDFVEPRRPTLTAWIIAGIAWALVAVLGIGFLHLRARVAQPRVAQLAAETRAKTPPVVAAPHVVPICQDDALVALRRAAFPEAEALAELEHVAVVGIHLRSIDVNPAASVIVVELEATSDEVLGDYLDQLNAGMLAPRWHIRRVAALGDAPVAAGGAPGRSAGGATRSATIARDIQECRPR